MPRLIKFSGVAQDETHKLVTGVVGVTFSLYKDQQGGSPLWVETQNVQADAAGHYTALLGSASADGVPLSLFSSAEAHWISTQISGQRESARVLLMSVPYALKAADAETLAACPRRHSCTRIMAESQPMPVRRLPRRQERFLQRV